MDSFYSPPRSVSPQTCLSNPSPPVQPAVSRLGEQVDGHLRLRMKEQLLARQMLQRRQACCSETEGLPYPGPNFPQHNTLQNRLRPRSQSQSQPIILYNDDPHLSSPSTSACHSYISQLSKKNLRVPRRQGGFSLCLTDAQALQLVSASSVGTAIPRGVLASQEIADRISNVREVSHEVKNDFAKAGEPDHCVDEASDHEQEELAGADYEESEIEEEEGIDGLMAPINKFSQAHLRRLDFSCHRLGIRDRDRIDAAAIEANWLIVGPCSEGMPMRFTQRP
ncbi:unnamed protein product [Protopolystoma xenopodis]|uniref:Uncharacterized protein n=1 Tax=Protopolystoma xenopodis TaxID=117903 RepID=A0A3S5FCJ3_9PLAT|nr:unnamed protein product [Protopolystoma xenopodis]